VSGQTCCYDEDVNFARALSPFKKLVLAVALGFAAGAAGLPPANLPPVPNTVDSITPAELRMHLDFLASQELGGRYTLSPSFAIAARYLAAHLQAYGFRGAGEHGGFLQPFEVLSSKPDAANTSLTLTLEGKSKTYELGDFSFSLGDGSADIKAPIVFAGVGISSPAQKHDDYSGLDAKGKIVLLAPGSAGLDPSGLENNEQGEAAARAHGAVAVLKIPSQRLAGFMRSPGYRDRVLQREDVRLSQEVEGTLPTVTIGPELAEKLLSLAGLSLNSVYAAAEKKQALEPKALDASARLTLRVHQSRATTQNVAGILEGADPSLRHEYVVFSAHYDHLQTSPTGQIYPGADDDGSGTTAVLAIAHALSLNRPRRSVLIIFHAGEELGLLGSEYNTEYAPAVPLSKLVVDLNIDMIGRSKPPDDTNIADEHLSNSKTVYLVGAGRISPELRQISEDTNAQFEKLTLDYYYDDPKNPERIYYRSDHWNYAKHGVPIIFYFDGVHADYHKPTDTVDKIDFNKLTQVTRLVFETGWRIANLDHRLSKAQ
jgi:hypothetical protein